MVNAASVLTLVKDGNAVYSIHAVTENQKQAAVILNKYVTAISGTTLPVVSIAKDLQIVFTPPPDVKFNVDQM
ncbi:MAG TPA: hypothetical protein PLO59_03635, partial [Bacteroidia bacterium]|nr:hypothetical protein [Bacteroidia bacterium]